MTQLRFTPSVVFIGSKKNFFFSPFSFSRTLHLQGFSPLLLMSFWYLWGPSRVFCGYFLGLSWCFMGISWVYPKYFVGISWVYPGYHGTINVTLSWCFMGISWVSPGYDSSNVKQSLVTAPSMFQILGHATINVTNCPWHICIW